jgi:uncharacterized iron-regulated membrane protein
VSPTDATKAWTPERLLPVAMAAVPDAPPTTLTTDADLTRPSAVGFGKDRVVYINNFTGKVVGTGAPRLRVFFRTVLALHRWLALAGRWQSWGRNITGVVTLGFLTLILSGVWLWMPRQFPWKSFKPVLLPNLRLTGKARDWNWHNVIGVWLATPLLVIVLTGLVIAYPWANRWVFRALGEQPPAPRAEARPPMGDMSPANRKSTATAKRALNLDGLDDLWSDAVDAAKPGWTSMSLRLTAGRVDDDVDGPPSDDAAAKPRTGKGAARGAITFVASYGDPNVAANRATLTFNRRTGELTHTESFATATPARKARLLLVPIHRGEVLGLPGMAIAAVTCLGTLVLVYTGFALSWRRLVRPLLKARRSTPNKPAVPEMAIAA